MDAPWNDERVRQLFAELQRLHPTTVRWSGPELGVALRRIDPSFDKRVLGDRSLKDLVNRLGDVGQWIDEGVGVFEFARAPLDMLHRSWWLAVTRDDAAPPLWLDLETLELERNAETVKEQPERYLLVPHVTDQLLRQSVADSELDSVAHIRRKALEPNAPSAWKEALRRLAIDQLTQWAEQHGIDPRRLGKTFSVHATRAPTATLQRSTGSHPLRARVFEFDESEALGVLRQLAASVEGDVRPMLAAMLDHAPNTIIDRLQVPARLLDGTARAR
jgi:hypothetical protein